MIGQTISHYQILKKLGEGGMGEVYLAQDTTLDRKVALKFLPERMQQDLVAQRRFLQEARAVASLDHPYICNIHEIGEIEGKSFIVMEYVDGENLMEKLKQGPLPAKDALRVAAEVAEALEVAHERGIVHRDLKPSNVMLTPQGHAKVMDFGLAKQVLPMDGPNTQQQTLTAVTGQGTIVGTIDYMSPEQARGEAVDPRSDIFSYGVLLYEMISGEHPFRRSNGLETISSILRDPPPPLQKPLLKVPAAGLNTILTQALAKDRAKRYERIHDLALDLRKLRERVAHQERRASLPRLAAGVLLVLAILAGLWLLVRQRPISSHRPEQTPKIVSVLLADFQNSTGETVFDRALEQAMAISLEKAPFVTSYDRGRARKIADQIQSGANRLDENMARLVAQREGINVIITGSIASGNRVYQISVKAFDSLTGKSIVSHETEAQDKERVLNAIERLAARTRSALGDTTPESLQLAGAETFTAASLEAARNYALGQEVQGTGAWEKTIPHYIRAIELDPDLGRAYAGLAVMHRNLGREEEAEKYYQMAMARIDRMTEREKYRTRGGYYVTSRNYPKAIEEFTALVKQYPADFVGHSNLALAYFLASNMLRALEEGERAIAIYPKNIVMRNNVALYALYAGDFKRATAEANIVIQASPNYESAYVCLALAELAQGRSTAAAEQYRRLQGLSASGASSASSGLADLALYQGRVSEAIAILEKGIAEDTRRNEAEMTARKRAVLASARLARGQVQPAVAEADRAVAGSSVEPVLFTAARVYLGAGRQEKALKLASELGARLQPESQLYSKLIEGEVTLRRGKPQEAIELFQQARQLSDTWLAHFDLGSAYLQAGAFIEAHSEFNLCLKRHAEAAALFLDDLPTYHYLPPVYYRLGQAQEGLKSPAAGQSYQTYVAIRGDGDDPLTGDVRRRLSAISPQR